MKLLYLLFSLFYSHTNTLPVYDHANFTGDIWVVLCAGAKGWENYAVTASVYHAYHEMRANGIPDERIIVMHYDDITHNPLNPTPGIVTNVLNGTDVYRGVPKHYTGADVNPKNFLGILKGDRGLAKQGKRVVNSGPNDHIFVYVLAHGDPGYTEFLDDKLMATDLNNALIDMHRNNRYAKLVFYLESCESGSIFDKLLPSNINVYAITSSPLGQISRQAFCHYDKTGLFTYCHDNLCMIIGP